MRIAICDDSCLDAEAIRAFCVASEQECMHSYSIFESGSELCEAYGKGIRLFDLIFLDVDMPDINGIEVGRRIRQADPYVVIVFTTSYPQYALEAYECEPLNYILKPCTQDKIANVLARTQQKIRVNTHYHVVKTKGKPIRILVSDIYYVECLRKHVVYHTASSVYDTVGNLSDAFEALRAFGFIRVHQGYIVNMDKILDFADRYVILDNGDKVEMSIRKKTQTLAAYAEFLERYI